MKIDVQIRSGIYSKYLTIPGRGPFDGYSQEHAQQFHTASDLVILQAVSIVFNSFLDTTQSEVLYTVRLRINPP